MPEIIKTEYTKKDRIKVTELHTRENGVVNIINVKGSLKQTNANANLPIRKEPNFEVRDAWFKTKDGFISAYRVEGLLEYVDEDKANYILNDYQIATNKSIRYGNKNYKFDENGNLIKEDKKSSK